MQQLQQKVIDPKGKSNINETKNNPSFKEPKQRPTHSKKAEISSKNNGGH